MELLVYKYKDDVIDYLDKESNLLTILRNRGLMGLNSILLSGIINERNNAIIFIFRNFISYIDALSVSVKIPSVENIKLLARALFEASCYLEYIIEMNTEERAIAYQNLYIIEKIKMYEKFDINTKAGIKFSEQWNRDAIFSKIPQENYDTAKDIDNLKNQLNREPYKSIYEKQALLPRSSKWYTLDSHKDSFFGLCEYLKHEVEYEIFYRSWSSLIHSSNAYDENIFVKNDTGNIEAIRSMNGYQSLVRMLPPLIVNLYEMLFRKLDYHNYLRLLRFIKNQYSDLINEIDRFNFKWQT